VPYLDRYAYLFEDPTVHVVLLNVGLLDRASFLGRLRERVNVSASKSAFVFVHGYNVSFKDACRQTAQVAWDMKFTGAPIMYSWPSDAALKNYGTDEERMNASVRMLEEFLWTIARDSGAQQVHIVAHSLGSRAVTAALNRMYETRKIREKIFDRVVMAAADIRAELFAHDRSAVQALSQSVTLYLSDSDVALKASGNVAHPGDRRVGSRPSPMVFYDGIDIVDASSVNYAWLGINHSYWSDKWQAIQDLSDLLRHVSQLRPLLNEQPGPTGRYWVLKVGR
jgi:esterase/lipase superfamily enzyme